MRLRAVCLIGFLFAASAAHAQTKAPKAPSGPEMRYFTSIDGLMDGNADVILKELRQGKTVQSATLDICYPATAGTDRKDRFIATLAPANGVLTGSATSQVDKQPVTVKLTQKPNGDNFEFKGQLTIGPSTVDVSSADNSDLSEKEFQEVQSSDDGIVQNPKDFTEVSPESVSVKVRVDQAAEFLKALRGQNVEVVPTSLGISCEALRSGGTVMSLSVDPLRATAFVASARTLPGVISAGWSGGLIDMDRTIRFAAAEWRDGDRINRDKVTSALTDVLASALQAKLDQAKWSDNSGKLKLVFKRPSQTFPTLGLTESLDVTALVAPDRPGATDRLMLWVGSAAITTRDETEGAKLNFGEATGGDEEGDAKVDTNVMEALARQFKAQRWDADTSAWK
jgi:hypothetical protein